MIKLMAERPSLMARRDGHLRNGYDDTAARGGGDWQEDASALTLGRECKCNDETGWAVP